MEVCGLDDGMAFSVMMKAHQLGISVIGNYHLEQAEMYKIRLLEGMFLQRGIVCIELLLFGKANIFFSLYLSLNCYICRGITC